MIENLSKKILYELAQDKALNKGILNPDITISNKDLLELFFNPPIFNFNSKNDFDSLNFIFEQFKKDKEFLDKLETCIYDEISDLNLQNKINKRKVYNELKALEKKLTTIISLNNNNVIDFQDFKQVNFNKTDCFIDLKNKKVLKNRIDNLLSIDGDISLELDNLNISNHDLNNLINHELYYTKCSKQNVKNKGAAKIHIRLKNPLYINRLSMDLLFAQDINLKITLITDTSEIQLINNVIFKTHFDRIISYQKINEIIIEVESLTKESFDFGIKNLSIYKDIYSLKENVLTLKEVNYNGPTVINTKNLCFDNSSMIILLGLKKDNNVTWKTISKNEFVSEDIDSFILSYIFNGNENNTPILEYVTITERSKE